jgi:hypothetical protein
LAIDHYNDRVGASREDNKLRSADRSPWLKAVLAVAFLGGFLLSARLWGVSRSYPLVPVLEGLAAVPPFLARVWFVALLALLAVIAVVRRSRAYILAFVVLAGLLGLLDQSRWQPWFYQYLFMFLALAFYPRGDGDPEKRETALNVCRLIVASTYLWSGLQKLNAGFFDSLFPWLVGPLVTLLPGSLGDPVRSVALVVPFVEASIGIGLLTRRFRDWAVVLALGMHAFVLFCIGPLGHGWNTVVWPWNVAMSVFVVLLFWRIEDFSPKKVLLPARRYPYLHTVVLVLFAVMPLFGLFGLWDSYLSASLYSGNDKKGTLFIDETVKDKMPAGIRERVADLPAGEKYTLNISRWSYEELNVPPYPETRVFRSLARYVCSYAEEPSGVRLEIADRPTLSDHRAEIYDCSSVETGEHETVKLAE